MLRISRPVRPACWAEASSRTPTSRPGLGRSEKSRPETRAVPDVGGVKPTMTRMVVDLPAPLGPRNPVTRPASAVKVTSSTAVKAPYLLVRESTVIMGRASLPTTPVHIGEVAGRAPDTSPGTVRVALRSPAPREPPGTGTFKAIAWLWQP